MKLSSFALALLGSALCLQSAQAATVAASISYDTAGRANTQGQVSQSLSSTGNDAIYLDSHAFSNFGRNSPDLRAAADGGHMWTYSRLHLEGTGQSTVSWQDTIHNSSNSAQNYEMNINVTNMQFHFAPVFDASFAFSSGYRADILVDGRSVWHSAQTFEQTSLNGPIEIHKEGFDLGNAVEPVPGQFHLLEIADYSGKVNLGSFAAGQSANVTYQLTSLVSWNSPQGCSDMECGRYLEASIADPFDITGGGSRIQVSAVPEADTWAMMLGGLGMIGLIAHRRRAA